VVGGTVVGGTVVGGTVVGGTVVGGTVVGGLVVPGPELVVEPEPSGRRAAVMAAALSPVAGNDHVTGLLAPVVPSMVARAAWEFPASLTLATVVAPSRADA
jgi:hypothetical protein